MTINVEKEYKSMFEDKTGIKEITNNLGVGEIFGFVSEFSDASSEYTIDQWRSSRKTCRTKYVIEAMGNDYPREILKLSLAIDSAVNHMDDLLDENLDKGEKAYHVLELSKDIGFIRRQKISEEQAKAIANYLKDKIPVIGAGEGYYTSLIKNSTGEREVLKLGKKYYDIRSIDMDVFVELPLLEIGIKGEEYNNIVNSGRIFRAIDLIGKDSKDMERDMENEVDTLLTIAKQKGLEPRVYARKLADEYMNDFRKIKKEKNEIMNNFYEMSKKRITQF